MSHESAAQFATSSRIHMGLAVRNLEQSIAFYRLLFGCEPTKVRPRYAKFEVAEPPVNLSLNEVVGTTAPSHPVSHFGVQVKSTEAVSTVAGRLTDAGIPIEREEQVSCCYAVQNKVWSADPDGNKWETYVLLDDHGTQHHASGSSCCPDLPAVIEAVQLGDIGLAQHALLARGGQPVCGCLAETTAR